MTYVRSPERQITYSSFSSREKPECEFFVNENVQLLSATELTNINGTYLTRNKCLRIWIKNTAKMVRHFLNTENLPRFVKLEP